MQPSGGAALIGVPLGVLIGIVTGLVLVLLLRSAFRQQKTAPELCSRMLALPAFWFGGPWITSVLLTSVNWAAILPSYIVSLMITFAIIAGFPILNAVVRAGADINHYGR